MSGLSELDDENYGYSVQKKTESPLSLYAPVGPRSTITSPIQYKQSNVNPSRQGRREAPPETVVYSSNQKDTAGRPVRKAIQVDVAPNLSDWYTKVPPADLMRATGQFPNGLEQGTAPVAANPSVSTPPAANLAFLDESKISRKDTRGPMTEARQDSRRTGINRDGLALVKPTKEDAAMIRAAQSESDYNKGRAFADAAVAAGGGSLPDVLPIGVKEGQSVRFVGNEDIPGRPQPGPPSDVMPAVVGSYVDPKTGKTMPLMNTGMAFNGTTQTGSVTGQPMNNTGFKYEIYGKDGLQETMTLPSGFMGKEGRQGGGTLSVVGGRTKEEQDAIDARVQQINSQIDAMRGLRNAARVAEGRPTVEQEEVMNYAQQMMQRAGPTGLNFAYQSSQAQAEQEAARAKALQEQRQWEARYQLDANKLNAEQQQALADYQLKAYGAGQKDVENAIKAAEVKNAASKGPIDSRMMSLLFNKDSMGNPTTINPQILEQMTGITVLGNEQPISGKRYLDPATNIVYTYDPQTGKKVNLGLMNLQ